MNHVYSSWFASMVGRRISDMAKRSRQVLTAHTSWEKIELEYSDLSTTVVELQNEKVSFKVLKGCFQRGMLHKAL